MLGHGAVRSDNVKKLLKKACPLFPFYTPLIEFLPGPLGRGKLHVSAWSIIFLCQDTSLCIITYTSGHFRIWEHDPLFFYWYDTQL